MSERETALTRVERQELTHLLDAMLLSGFTAREREIARTVAELVFTHVAKWPRKGDAPQTCKWRDMATALGQALEEAAQDIRDWVKTARGLRERVADPDRDPSTPHLRGIQESERILTRIYAVQKASRSMNENVQKEEPIRPPVEGQTP